MSMSDFMSGKLSKLPVGDGSAVECVFCRHEGCDGKGRHPVLKKVVEYHESCWVDAADNDDEFQIAIQNGGLQEEEEVEFEHGVSYTRESFMNKTEVPTDQVKKYLFAKLGKPYSRHTPPAYGKKADEIRENVWALYAGEMEVKVKAAKPKKPVKKGRVLLADKPRLMCVEGVMYSVIRNKLYSYDEIEEEVGEYVGRIGPGNTVDDEAPEESDEE